MSILDSAGRFGASLLAMLQTRVELASVELQEEAQRALRYLVLSLAALFLAAMTVILVTFLVVLLFWDENPLTAVAVLAVLYGAGAFLLMAKVKSEIRSRPALLSHTLAELRKDVECMRGGASHE